MAKTDLVDSVKSDILNDDVSYKSALTSTLMEQIAANLNNLCDCISGFKCEVLPFGTTSWTAPPNFITGVAVGFSGGGGGGGTAPANNLFGVDNVTFYAGTSGSAGGSTQIGGQLIASGGSGGTRFTFVTVNDNGASTSESEYCPVNPRYSSSRDYVKGLRVPVGGTGAHTTENYFSVDGLDHYQGGALGGQAGNIGAVSLDFMTGGTSYPVVIGAGGAGGTNDPFTATWAANAGYTIVNALNGQNSPGMVIFYMEKA